jgi:exoribonuclease-2
VFRVAGCENLPRGARVAARITGMDLLTLDLHASLAQRLDAPAEAAEAAEAAPEDLAEDDEAAGAGTLQLAIDLGEPPPAPDADPVVPG